MSSPVTSSFRVDGVWYEMEYCTLRSIQREIGGDPTNRQIVEYLHANLPRFSCTEANGAENPDGTFQLFVYVNRR